MNLLPLAADMLNNVPALPHFGPICSTSWDCRLFVAVFWTPICFMLGFVLVMLGLTLTGVAKWLAWPRRSWRSRLGKALVVHGGCTVLAGAFPFAYLPWLALIVGLVLILVGLAGPVVWPHLRERMWPPKLLVVLGVAILLIDAFPFGWSYLRSYLAWRASEQHLQESIRRFPFSVYRIAEAPAAMSLPPYHLDTYHNDPQQRMEWIAWVTLFRDERLWTKLRQIQRPADFPSRCPVQNITVAQGIRLPCRLVATTSDGHQIYQSVLPDEPHAQGVVLVVAVDRTLLIFDFPRAPEADDLATIAQLLRSMTAMTPDELLALAHRGEGQGSVIPP